MPTTFLISKADIDVIFASLNGIERRAKSAITDPDAIVAIKDDGDAIYQVLNRLQPADRE